jgi:O-antigen/teichoic acid export membrane protein
VSPSRRAANGRVETARPVPIPPQPSQPARRWLREHLSDPLYRTGYYLILGTGITSLLGVGFWALAAHSYTASVVGLNAAAISAMTLVAEACTLGLSAVLVRYLPVAGASTRRLVAYSYAVTFSLALLVATAVALSSSAWSSDLGFLASGGWLVGFVLAAAGTTIFTLQDSVLTGLRAARWIPLENALYALSKLLLLIGLATTLTGSGPFVAWTAPLAIAVLVVNVFIFRRLIPASPSRGSIDRRKLISMATGNYAGKLFTLAGNLYMPILVANRTSPAEAAYFFVPWMISLGIELVALNVMTSLTVEAASDMGSLRQRSRRALWHSLRIVAPIAILAAIVAPWALLVFGSDYADEGASLLRLLAAGMIPNVIVALGVTVARVQHRGRVVVAIQGAHAAMVLGASAVLLPSMGIIAVGLAWTVSQTLLAAILIAGLLRPVLFGPPVPDHTRMGN